MPLMPRPVERTDLSPLFKMAVLPDQKSFVAPNEFTLAQAAYEPGAQVFCLWSGETRVGLMAVMDFRDAVDLEAHDDPQGAYLWRLLIDPAHQRRGHGRAAVHWFLDWARSRGCQTAATSAAQGNAVALALYQSCGFQETGIVSDGEIVVQQTL